MLSSHILTIIENIIMRILLIKLKFIIMNVIFVYFYCEIKQKFPFSLLLYNEENNKIIANIHFFLSLIRTLKEKYRYCKHIFLTSNNVYLCKNSFLRYLFRYRATAKPTKESNQQKNVDVKSPCEEPSDDSAFPMYF